MPNPARDQLNLQLSSAKPNRSSIKQISRTRGISRPRGSGRLRGIEKKKLTGMPKTFCGCSDMVTAVKVFPLNKKKGLRGDGEMKKERERMKGGVERNKSAPTGGERYLGRGKKNCGGSGGEALLSESSRLALKGAGTPSQPSPKPASVSRLSHGNKQQGHLAA